MHESTFSSTTLQHAADSITDYPTDCVRPILGQEGVADLIGQIHCCTAKQGMAATPIDASDMDIPAGNTPADTKLSWLLLNMETSSGLGCYLQHELGLLEQLLGFSTHIVIIEDLGVASVGVPPSQLPCLQTIHM